MAIGSRGESGVGGGGRGMSTGGSRGPIYNGMGPKKAAPKKSTAKKAVLTKAEQAAQKARLKAAAARVAASTPSVKVVEPSKFRALKNKSATITAQFRKSGMAAQMGMRDVVVGKPKATVKINSAIKTAKPSAATIKATKKALKRISK